MTANADVMKCCANLLPQPSTAEEEQLPAVVVVTEDEVVNPFRSNTSNATEGGGGGECLEVEPFLVQVEVDINEAFVVGGDEQRTIEQAVITSTETTTSRQETDEQIVFILSGVESHMRSQVKEEEDVNQVPEVKRISRGRSDFDGTESVVDRNEEESNVQSMVLVEEDVVIGNQSSNSASADGRNEIRTNIMR